MKHKTNKSSRSLFEQYLRGPQERSAASKESAATDRSCDQSSLKLVCEFFRLIRRHRGLLVVSWGLLTLSVVLALLPPFGTKVLIDYVLGDKELPDWLTEFGLPSDRSQLLAAGIVAVLVLAWLKSLFHVWSRWYANILAARVQLSVGKRLFEHALRLPLHRVYELKTGGVTSVLRQDAAHIGDLIMTMLYNPWRALVQLIGSLCVLTWVDWRLMVCSSLVMPVVYLSHRSWISSIRPQHRHTRVQRESVDALVTEVFGGLRVVRGFGREHREAARFVRGNHLMVRMKMRNWWATLKVEMLWMVIVPVAAALLMFYGGNSVLSGQLTVGDLMMFLVYMLMLLGPLAVLAQSAATFQNGLSALDRVLELFAEPREVFLSPGREVPTPGQRSRGITFDRVSFRYPGAKSLALRNIELTVEPSEMIALVGASGSGKTTLCDLVARFYDPTDGRILLDGRDLRQFDIEAYRRVLGVVDQDVFLFDGTVAENVGYANPNASLDEIREAAELAYADEFIRKLDDGYDTVIGERGTKLSGGQRQRLAIARAILADPSILILDEATSNLDSHSEQLIRRGLAALTVSRTSLVIAHRLSTITHADWIVVMEQGSIVEVGTHGGLIDSDSRYREMIECQMTTV